MKDFNFITTKELNKALDILNELDNVKIIAGGTDLIVDMRKYSKRLPEIDYLLDISNIDELKFVRMADGYIEIGPLVTHNMLINNPQIINHFPILVEAARCIGSNQIRNRGTIGGNICNSSPCADTVPPLIALDAQVEIRSKDSVRAMQLEKFITGQYKNALEKNEIISSIKIPVDGRSYYSYYYKVGRRKALNISRLTVALIARVEEGIFEDVRFVPGAVTSYPVVFYKTQDAICGKQVSTIDPNEVGRIAREEMLSITGERWSTEYKKPVISALTRRALESVIKEANV